MSIQIGRAGGDATLPLPSPTTVERSDNGVRLRGNLWSETSVALGRVLREQVIGLDPAYSPGLPARPVIYAPGDIARFGRVVSASCGTSRAAEATGVWPYDIDIEWVTSSHAPLLEERLIGALRTQPSGTANPHGISAANTIAAHGAGVDVYGYDGGGAFYTGRTGADGAVRVSHDTAETLFAAVPTWYVEPDDFYKGAAQIVRTLGQSPLVSPAYTVVGREMPNYPSGWGVYNSLVAVLGSTSTTEAQIIVLWHDGSAYKTPKTIRVAGDLRFDAAATQVRVLRNSPECCAIRVFFRAEGSDVGYLQLDITLRRGSRTVECVLEGTDSFAYQVYANSEALTSITGGARATNTDAEGDRIVVATPQAYTVVTNRVDLSSAATRYAFGLSCAVGGNTGSDFDQAQGLIYEYFAAVNGTQRVVIP